MSLSQQRVLYKEKYPSVRLRSGYKEGRCIRAQAILHGLSLKKITDILGVSRASVHYVIYGKRRSARIEDEIARILGKASWNDVVLEARSEVQKKPVKVILQEMERESKKALNEGIQKNAHNAIYNKDWSAHLKAFEEEQAAERKRRGA